MAKKKATARKPSGAAGIETIEEAQEVRNGLPMGEANATSSDDGSHAEQNRKATKPMRKAKVESQSNGNFGVGDIRKAAGFANSIGGLDKAIALLQILKVAKEVQ